MLQRIDIFPKPDAASAPRAKQLGEQPHIHPSARIRQSQLGAWSDIVPNCALLESSLGDYSYLAGDVAVLYAEIGKFCSIASHVTINPGNHPMGRVTQHHCTYRRVQYGLDDHDDEGFFDWRRDDQCVIGHDVWIGHGATVVVGVPARPIRKRFSDDVIEKLLRVAWWDWDRPTLEERFHDLMDLDAFLAKYA
jgi:hypothetical protein